MTSHPNPFLGSLESSSDSSSAISTRVSSEDFDYLNTLENGLDLNPDLSFDEDLLLNELPFILETLSQDLTPGPPDSQPLSINLENKLSLDEHPSSPETVKQEPNVLVPETYLNPSPILSSQCSSNSSMADSTISFPFKLYFLMAKHSSSDESAVVSWSQNGLCFNINNTEIFSRDIIPIFFKRKFSSFLSIFVSPYFLDISS